MCFEFSIFLKYQTVDRNCNGRHNKQKMKRIKLTTLIFGLLLFGCNQTITKTTSSTDQTSAIVSDDKEKLLQLVRRLYEWHETKSSHNDFEPVADNQDSTYIGLDLKKHEQRLTELKQTGFFADQFLDNYNELGLAIGKGLKSKKLEWQVGDLPPFGNDANPWCNCQDNPDNYWQKVTIDKIGFDNNTATFTWTWGENFEYKVNAIKQNDNWKISYLQGFGFNEYILTK